MPKTRLRNHLYASALALSQPPLFPDASLATRRCRRCNQEVSINDFPPNMHGGYSRYCRRCPEGWSETPELKRDRNLRRLYGITAHDYDTILAAQQGVCAICGNTQMANPVTKGTGKRYGWLEVDHDHDTGRVRGLLCRACNTGIGGLRHSEANLMAAIRYLRQPPTTHLVRERRGRYVA